jgi:acyl carrier protein
VRGFRIELGEIESVLDGHPSLCQAVVRVHEYPSKEKRLVAYVVPAADVVPNVGELRAYAKEKLPEYMVPATIIVMDSLPLTPNGKVDKKTLHLPQDGRANVTDYVAPETEFEQRIAAMWRDVLHVERVGINDNFFDLGGHSLLILKIHAQLQQTCGTDLDLITLFKYPTISALARHLGEKHSTATNVNQNNELLQQRQQRAQNQRDALARQKKLSERMVVA